MSSPRDVLHSLVPPSNATSSQRSRSPIGTRPAIVGNAAPIRTGASNAGSGSANITTNASSSSSGKRRSGDGGTGAAYYGTPNWADDELQESLESLTSKGAAGGFQELRALVSLPFFENFDQRSAKKLSQAFVRRTLAFGETLVQQGQAHEGFHVLVRGRVDMLTTGPDGQERLIERRSNPAYFGTQSLIEGGLEPMTVRASEEGSIVLSIGLADFEAFIQENPNVRVALEYKHGALGGSGVNAAVEYTTPPPPTGGSSSLLGHSMPSRSASFAPSATGNSTLGGVGGSSLGSFTSSTSPFSTSNITASPITPDLETLKLHVSLRDIPFFQQVGKTIPEMKLQQLATLFEFRRCPPGEVLMREHDVADGFYILLEGRINVSALAPNHQAMHLNTLRDGNIFGEIGCLYKVPRTATLTTIQACTMLYLNIPNFETFLRLAPEVRENGVLTSIVQKRIGSSLKTVPLFSFLRVKEFGPLRTYKEEVLEKLGKLFIFEFVPKNSIVFKEGDLADAFYIIHRGAVEVCSKANPIDDDQDELICMSEKDAEGQLILTELGQSDFFGELSLLSSSLSPTAASSSSSTPPHPLPSSSSRPQARRTASVKTLTDCVFLKLPAQHFQTFLQIVPEIKHTLDRVISMRTAQTLANIPFFRLIRENKPWSKLSILGGMFRFRHYACGDIVVQEGELGDTFFVIVDGSVEVTKTVHHPRHGPEQVVLDILGRSDWFGELSLLKETVRLATVRCREDCLFLTVTKEKFDKFCQIAPDIVDSFSSLVTHRTANMLRCINFFYDNIVENKPWSKLELLCTLFVYEYVDSGVVLMREGDDNEETNKLYVLSVGSVMAARRRLPDDPVSDAFPLSATPSPSPSSPATPATEQPIPTLPAPTAAASSSSSSSSSFTLPNQPMSSSATGVDGGGLDLDSDSVQLNVDRAHPPPSLQVHIQHVPIREDPTCFQKILERGSFFNETTLLRSGEARPLTITTLEPCVFFTLTRAKFDKFCQVCPELKESLLKMYPNSAGPTTEKATARAAAASHILPLSTPPEPHKRAISASSSSSSLSVPASSTVTNIPVNPVSGRPLRHSGSFSSSLTVPVLDENGEYVQKESKAFGRTVMTDSHTIHAHDGTILSSRQVNSTSPPMPSATPTTTNMTPSTPATPLVAVADSPNLERRSSEIMFNQMQQQQ